MELQAKKPFVVTIAGYDPCGGAGILADIKTFEQCNVYGLSVITCDTIQSENKFKALRWRTTANIITQLKFLLKEYPIKAAKIGLIKDIDMLTAIVKTLKIYQIKIILDPILVTSTSKIIFQVGKNFSLQKYLSDIFLITPNYDEALLLTKVNSLNEAGKIISKYTNVVIKGGHNSTKQGTDVLFEIGHSLQTEIKPFHKNIYTKHGSGCVFSAALTASIAMQTPILESVKFAKRYTEKFLKSNKTLLGYHAY